MSKAVKHMHDINDGIKPQVLHLWKKCFAWKPFVCCSTAYTACFTLRISKYTWPWWNWLSKTEVFSPHGNSLHISTMLRSLPDTSPFGKVPGPLVKVVVFVEPLLDPYP